MELVSVIPTGVGSAPLCQCGKRLKHVGRCSGFKLDKSQAPRRKTTNLLAMLEVEVSSVRADVVRLKREIREKQDDLTTAESKLKPLAELLKTYENKRIGPPVASTSLITTTQVEPDEDAPVEAGFEQIQRWAAQRGLTFDRWDHLDLINERREKFDLPPFVRKARA